MMKKIIIYLFLFFPCISNAQIQLTLINAVDSALKNNFDIQIARNNSQIGEINNTYGNAGGLPSLNGTLGANGSVVNLNQKLSSGVNTVRNDVVNKSMNSNITASMLLFNGFQITAAKERLNQLQKQSLSQLNLQIQNTIALVMDSYYDILRQQNYLRIIQTSLDVSAKKLEIVKNRYEVGMANQADLLQAKMDLSAAEQDLKSQQLVISHSRTNLLELMGTKHFYDYLVSDTIAINRTIQKEFILKFIEENPAFVSANQQVKINEQIVKERRASRYPSLRINTGYNYTYNTSSAGFNLFTKNYGPTVGATMQIPVFNGNIYRTQQKVATLNVRNAEIEKENVLTALKADATRTFDSYQNMLQQIDTQQISYQDAIRLVDILIQRFRLNQATILDLKAAQASFEAAGNTLVNLQYSAKIAEIELNRLVSRLGNMQ